MPHIRAGWLLDRRWDVIVIGSGVGGLVAANLLAAHGQSVLVLERHYETGGLTQAFTRRGYHFDTGVHYLGDLGAHAPLRRLFEGLAPAALAFQPLPRVYEKIRGADLTLDLGGAPNDLRAQLLATAPDEGPAIDRYLEDVLACARLMPSFFFDRMRPRSDVPRNAPIFRFSDRTTDEALHALGMSRRLAGIVTYAWGNYACPPSRSSFAAHAIQVAHYLAGEGRAFYPVGGGQAISDALASALVRRGGAVVVRAGVQQIRVEGSRATGVILEDGRELPCERVIAATGASTALRLLPAHPALDALRERVASIGPSSAHVALYLGLRASPRELGLDGCNHWLGESIATMADEQLGAAWVRGAKSAPPGVFVSAGSANDPAFSARHPGRTTLEATVVMPRDPFDGWSGTVRAKRGPDYEALKARLSQQLASLVFAALPQLASAVDHVELSTPLSTEHFASYARGEACGLDHKPRRFREGPYPATPIGGLFLTGQDVWLSGVAGAAFGGVLTASSILQKDLARALLWTR